MATVTPTPTSLKPTSPTLSPTKAPVRFANVPTSDIQHMLDNMAENGMVSPSDMLKLQTAANAEIEKRRREATLDKMTFRDAVVDAHEALVGIMSDVTQGSDRKSLKDIFVYENRLRGLGLLLIGLALVGLFADYIVSA